MHSFIIINIKNNHFHSKYKTHKLQWVVSINKKKTYIADVNGLFYNYLYCRCYLERIVYKFNSLPHDIIKMYRDLTLQDCPGLHRIYIDVNHPGDLLCSTFFRKFLSINENFHILFSLNFSSEATSLLPPLTDNQFYGV